MTFDESERSDWPHPTWISKDNGVEEIASEIQTVTTENVLQRTRSMYDQKTAKITNEIAIGVCGCGKPVRENSFAMCLYSDLICGNCTPIFHNGRQICRSHTEYYLGSKEETMILVSIILGMKINEIKMLSGLSEQTIKNAKNMLGNRKYIKDTSFGIFFNSKKITGDGNAILNTLVEAYRTDSDFRDFLKNTGWSNNVESESGQK